MCTLKVPLLQANTHREDSPGIHLSPLGPFCGQAVTLLMNDMIVSRKG